MVPSYSFLQPNKVIDQNGESHGVKISKADQASAFKPATIRGISIGTARALLRARAPHLAMLVDVLTALGEVPKITTRPELTRELEGVLTEEQIRNACNEASGRPYHRNPKKNSSKQKVSEKLLVFQDLLVKLSSNSIKPEDMDKMTKKSSDRRGRPRSIVCVPSEEQLKAVLEESSIITKHEASRRHGRLQEEFSTRPSKPLEVFKNSTTYKDFVMYYQVFQHGTSDYSRNELTAPIGDNPRNARRRAQRTGIKVTPNAPKLKLLKEQNEKTQIPKDKATRLRWIAQQKCTESHHISTGEIDSKRYPYTWAGAQKARKASKTGEIYIAVDQKSTYDPTTSRYYTGLKESIKRNGGWCFRASQYQWNQGVK